MKEIDSAVDLALGISNGGANSVNKPVSVGLSDLAGCLDEIEFIVGEFAQLHGWMLEIESRRGAEFRDAPVYRSVQAMWDMDLA